MISDSNANLELNAGSLSFRSLFVGIVSNERLNRLSDRRGGLGSGRQMLQLYREIETDNRWRIFTDKLKLFLEYLYGDVDLLIAFKEGERMTIHFIEGESFVRVLSEFAMDGPTSLAGVIHRWENNNIRLKLIPLFRRLEGDQGYNIVVLDFCKIPENNQITRLIESKKEDLRNDLYRLLLSG